MRGGTGLGARPCGSYGTAWSVLSATSTWRTARSASSTSPSPPARRGTPRPGPSSRPVKVEGESLPFKEDEYRLTKLGHYSSLDIHRVHKGKICTVELLTFLNNHKLHPETWTAEKIAEEYSLELKDVTSLLKYHALFNMEVPESEDKKSIEST
ncbi:PREDICTED: NADH dehydrogenase [ubiquinone] 1 alpha subcomplex assembly factor 4 isoform X2 [Crocodylus porosus]|uniref:NADH dehydrogenase [ubiquinone] 1 alpha subcomplex assembly factor 4 isoform X2 n=1 Tax=Crocodylus porosus TaxID=8502 RepID=UPI00093C08D7|nr:PREDICTED: NADH dehydrogenase [ubiquinone] 1 alpha subcomplex assembly factor 4 isoform X2 [Crocodylus porosus]